MGKEGQEHGGEQREEGGRGKLGSGEGEELQELRQILGLKHMQGTTGAG